MSRFLNHYKCACGEEWQDEWDCMCNDRCPNCNAETEPFESIDLDEQDAACSASSDVAGPAPCPVTLDDPDVFNGIARLAELRIDGEDDEDGEPFEQTTDDAFETASHCINTARDLLEIMDKRRNPTRSERLKYAARIAPEFMAALNVALDHFDRMKAEGVFLDDDERHVDGIFRALVADTAA